MYVCVCVCVCVCVDVTCDVTIDTGGERNRVNDVTISRDLEISCEFVNISSSREPHFGDLNLRSQPRSEFTQSEVRVRAEHKRCRSMNFENTREGLLSAGLSTFQLLIRFHARRLSG